MAFLHTCDCSNVPGASGPGVPLCTIVPRDVHFKKNKLRWFLPTPDEFDSSKLPPLAWYAHRSVTTIWNWGNPPKKNRPQYDSIRGGSGYSVNDEGGTFNLSAWMEAVEPTLCCYDLAAITQLASAVCLTSDQEEMLASTWIFQQPTGYVKEGPLYGQPAQDNNNPFWRAPCGLFSSLSLSFLKFGY